ncbi:MAG: hypothetical protein PHR25_01015 [Clostridia bacterium]|nr:hypothetical protein [Clostridia bacterium]
MLILFIMILYTFHILNKNIDDKCFKSKVIKILILGFIFQTVLLIIYRLELNSLGRIVYYSDANDYWNATLDIMNGNSTVQYNKVYYISCAIIQKCSPFIWVGWNNIFNILCVNLTIVISTILIYKTLKFKSDSNYEKQSIIFLIINLFNPLIYYSLMRNLKDAEFLLLVIIMVYGLQKLIYNKTMKNYIIYIIKLSIITILLLGIRPWGFLIGVTPLLVLIFQKNKSTYEKVSIIILLSAFVVLFMLLRNNIIGTLQMWVPIVLNSAQKRGMIINFIGVIKLFLGPGPVRSIFGETYFVFYTVSGNIMSAIGSLMWLIELPILVILFLNKKNILKKASAFTIFMFVFLIMYIMIYVMQYGGSTELRMRGVLYVTLSAAVLSTTNTKLRRQDVLLGIMLSTIILLITSLIFV